MSNTRIDLGKLERALTIPDGLCRDINFAEGLPVEAAMAVLDALALDWPRCTATDYEGTPVASAEFPTVLARPCDALRIQYEGGTLIPDLRAFCYVEPATGVFIEPTYWPEDLVADRFAVEAFLALLRKLVLATGQPEFYVRKEDASWRHDEPRTADVILSHREVLG